MGRTPAVCHWRDRLGPADEILARLLTLMLSRSTLLGCRRGRACAAVSGVDIRRESDEVSSTGMYVCVVADKETVIPKSTRTGRGT